MWTSTDIRVSPVALRGGGSGETETGAGAPHFGHVAIPGSRGCPQRAQFKTVLKLSKRRRLGT
jgi:hypothetical protein